MFSFAILIGIYSYLIFTLGLLGIFYKANIVLTTLIYGLLVFYFYRKKIRRELISGFELLKQIRKTNTKIAKRNWLFVIGFSILVFQGIVNLIGTMGPELGFDALWYHLTIPKIYLQSHSASYIPGGLLYYSAMPKLTEMLYVVGLAFGSEIYAKLIHFSFGILTLIALYFLSRKFLSKTYSLLVLVLFYSNLVVGWMSISAYIDLARTFFEIMALWGFINWIEGKEKKWFILSTVMLGFAISTKLLAVGSLLIFSLLILYFFSRRKINIKTVSIGLLDYWVIGLSVVVPWLVFSYIYTGNPVYPFFTNIYPIKFNFNLINPLNLSDPISPLYTIFLPITLVLYKKFKFPLKIVALYSFIAIIIWYITPQTGGGRFILPYLPAFSLITVAIISQINQAALRNIFIGSIVILALFSLIYRGAANSRYIPVILGQQSKSQFLTNHLNFSFGDFYDTDGYFTKKIKKTDTILLYGFHNLYYVNFPFLDSSYVKKGDLFNYIAVQGNNFPERFRFWNLIYYNNKTNVRLYYMGGLKWVY